MEKSTKNDLTSKEQISTNNKKQKESESLLKRAFRLFKSKSFIKQGIKFAFVGAIGTFVNLSILYILTDVFGILYLISEAFAFGMALLNNYILNKVSTFEENLQEKVMGKAFKFAFICILALIVNLTILYILVEYFNIFYLFAEIFAIGCAFLINFIGNRFWTFRHKTKSDRSIERSNRSSVEFIMSIWILTLGSIDIFFGFEKLDIIYILLGLPLLFFAFYIMIKVVFLYHFKQK